MAKDLKLDWSGNDKCSTKGSWRFYELIMEAAAAKP